MSWGKEIFTPVRVKRWPYLSVASNMGSRFIGRTPFRKARERFYRNCQATAVFFLKKKGTLGMGLHCIAWLTASHRKGKIAVLQTSGGMRVNVK